MDILIIGTGYVGLVTGACFAEMGHQITCLDIDADKISSLKEGKIPFFEPGLEELVRRNIQGGRLHFTTNYSQAVKTSYICFIAVPTPSRADGSCDLQYILAATQNIAEQMDHYTLIINKSTAPVGTAAQIKNTLVATLQKRGLTIPFDIVANPEFLKEGGAVIDCMKPDRIVIGAESEGAIALMKEIYAPFTVNRDRILIMDIASAEMTKYAANAMLATRISFMNELAHICEKVGANINEVRVGIGSDSRIGYQFLYAGIGYGGSCFPKDIRALIALAKEHQTPTPLLTAVEAINQTQRALLFQKLARYFTPHGGMAQKTIALWGLSFKPDTDDLREAPSLTLIEELLRSGAHLRLYDPVALSKAKTLLCDHPQITFCTDEYHAAKGADAIALVTEWKQFRFVDFNKVLPLMRNPALFDGRNQYKKSDMHKKGFDYFGIGIPEQ